MTEQQRDPDNPFGYHNPELQDPMHQGDWSGEKFQSIEQAYSEYEKLEDPEKRYPIPEWMTPFAKEYEDLKYNVTVQAEVINKVLQMHNEAIETLQNRLKEIPNFHDIKYKPPGTDEYLSIKEVFDDIYKRLEDLQ